jgi:hypothetical protein
MFVGLLELHTFKTLKFFWNKRDRKIFLIFHMILDHGAMYVTYQLKHVHQHNSYM